MGRSFGSALVQTGRGHTGCALRPAPNSAVEPGVFHAPLVVRAVDPDRDAFDIGIGTGDGAWVKDDWTPAILGQELLDLPDDLPPFFDIGFGRLLVDQLVYFRVAVTGVVALRTAQIILVEHLVRIVEAGLGNGEGKRIILAHYGRIPLRGVRP